MKTLKYIPFVLITILVLNSCGKDWLDVKPKGTTLEDNYYQNADEVYSGLVAAYDPLGWEVVKDYSSKVGLLNSASDECYAGGGSYGDRATWEAWSSYTLDPAVGLRPIFGAEITPASIAPMSYSTRSTVLP